MSNRYVLGVAAVGGVIYTVSNIDAPAISAPANPIDSVAEGIMDFATNHPDVAVFTAAATIPSAAGLSLIGIAYLLSRNR